ncbi:hypothetical protein [Paraburkholderia youngii]|uniref:hypothetical protein n=1 Tax=Paraburkholderia youngii TaxID=2782701 RepID=UPI003D1F59A3
MTRIASAAGMTAANLYVYFDPKLAILFEVYRPWLRATRHAERGGAGAGERGAAAATVARRLLARHSRRRRECVWTRRCSRARSGWRSTAS